MNRRGETGLTLVELMIAMVISGIVISAALAMGFSMMNGYRDHRAMVLVERSARVSLDIMADAIRNSNPGVPTDVYTDAVGCPGSSIRGISVTNNPDAPDEIGIIYAAGGIFTSIYQETPFGQNDTTLTVLDADVERGGIDGQDLYPGDYIIVTHVSLDPDEPAALVAITEVEAVATGYQLTVSPATGCGPWPASGFASGSLVFRARYARFYIEDDATVGFEPTLMMDPDPIPDGGEDPEPIAEGIEDMQIAVAYDDVVVDGAISEVGEDPGDDEWYYNVAGEVVPAGTEVPRAVRITLVAKSIREQSEVDSYTRPGAEDREAGAEQDPFRRRVLSTTIEIRNGEASP